MNCKLTTIGEADGKTIHVCSRCKTEIRTKQADAFKIKKPCGRAGKATPPRGPCVHIGEEMRRVECPSCKGKIQVKVLACAVFSEATIGKTVAGIACCQGCPQHKPAM